MCAADWAGLAAVHLNNHLSQSTVPRFTTTHWGHLSNSLSSLWRSVIVFAGGGGLCAAMTDAQRAQLIRIRELSVCE